MTKLLIPEPPLQVLPSLAVAIGLNEAIIVQQVHYWLVRSTFDHDGRRWVYNTLEQWHAQFPFWSPATIKRAIRVLQDMGLLIVAKLSEDKRDRTNYYTIAYDKLNDLTTGSSCAGSSDQIDPMLDQVKLTQCYKEQETTTETTQRKKQDRANALTPPDDVSEQTWNDWLSLRRAKKAPITQTVVDQARREAAKCRPVMTLEKFLVEWCLRGSQGLKADWINNASTERGHEKIDNSAVGRIARNTRKYDDGVDYF